MMRLVLNFCYRNGFNAGKRPDRHGDVGHGNDKREARMSSAITNWSTNLVERYLPDLATIAGLKAKDVMGFCLIALIVSGVVYHGVAVGLGVWKKEHVAVSVPQADPCRARSRGKPCLTGIGSVKATRGAVLI